MKYFFLSVFSGLSVVHAQEALNPLNAPSSPASAVLGMEPGSVLAPKSYEALETALYSNFMNSSNSAVIPNDFAMEFTPYWTKDHGLSLEEYLFPKSLRRQMARTSSFSLASTKNFLLGDSSATDALAFGYRATMYVGNKNDTEKIKAYRKKLDNSDMIQVKLSGKASSLINKETIRTKQDFLDTMRVYVKELIRKRSEDASAFYAEEVTARIYENADKLPPLDKARPDSLLDAFYNLVNAGLQADTLYSEFKSYMRERQGFYMDFAYGAMLNFPDHDFEYSVMPGQSVWLTPSYRFGAKLSALKIMAVFRYEWHYADYYRKYFPASVFYQNNVDYGVGIAGEFKRFSLNFECVGRFSKSENPAGLNSNGDQLYIKKSSSDMQYLGAFSFRVTDQIVLTYKLGNRFDPVPDPSNTLVSLVSLNFGFGAPTTNDLE